MLHVPSWRAYREVALFKAELESKFLRLSTGVSIAVLDYTVFRTVFSAANSRVGLLVHGDKCDDESTYIVAICPESSTHRVTRFFGVAKTGLCDIGTTNTRQLLSNH